MWYDIEDLTAFYDHPLGQRAVEFITPELKKLLPNLRGMSLAGIGYCDPYLTHFVNETERIFSLQSQMLGAHHWTLPDYIKARRNKRDQGFNINASAVIDELNLPFESASLDRFLIIHQLEYSDHPRAFLREAWRVLKDGGRMIVVIPARRGLWTRFDHTPFGAGHAYNRAQLTKLFHTAKFEPISYARALYWPPFKSPFHRHIAKGLERFGKKFTPRLGSVLIVEVEKRTFIPLVEPVSAFKQSLLARPTNPIGIPAT